MSYSLNSLKGDYIGDNIGTTIEVIKVDTRSLVALMDSRSTSTGSFSRF